MMTQDKVIYDLYYSYRGFRGKFESVCSGLHTATLDEARAHCRAVSLELDKDIQIGIYEPPFINIERKD